MLFKLHTDKTVSEAAAALQTAVEANHFGVMQVHNLKETIKGSLRGQAVNTGMFSSLCLL